MGEPRLADRLAELLKPRRYDWRTVSRCGQTFEEPYLDPTGEWIDDRFDEVLPALVALLERECERVRRETIEECIEVAQKYDNAPTQIYGAGVALIINRLRDLKEPPCPK